MALEIIDLNLIDPTIDTQCRATMNYEVIESYAERMIEGDIFPPIKVVCDSAKYYIADGWHRYHAYLKARIFNIQCEIIHGTRRDAVLIALGANSSHGLRRTNADKRKAVLMMLNDEEWQNWSSSNIAKACKISPHTVEVIRREFDEANNHTMQMHSIKPPETRTFVHPKTGQPTQMNISNMRKPEPRPEPQPPKIEYIEPDEPEEEDDTSDYEYIQEEYREFKESIMKELDYFSRKDNSIIQKLIPKLKQIFVIEESIPF